MAGARGRKNEGDGNVSDDNTSGEGHQEASKTDVKKTLQVAKDLDGKITQLNDTIDNVTTKLDCMESKFSQHELRQAYLEAKTRSLQIENKNLRNRVDVLENDRRSCNLKIDGVIEEDRANLADIVLRIAAAIGVRCQPRDIDFVYCIGKAHPEGRPRPILVHFKSQALRDNIYYG